MIQDFFVTDITDMSHGNICIAGVNAQNENIRPIREERIPGSWCRQVEHMIKPFSHILLDMEEMNVYPPHTEDNRIDSNYLEFIRDLQNEEKQRLLNRIVDHSIEGIFGADLHQAEGEQAVYIRYGEGNRSLGTIQPLQTFSFRYARYDHQWDSRLSFSDQTGKSYRAKIKDITFQNLLAHRRIHDGWDCQQIENHFMQHIFNNFHGFLRIGLARRWGKHKERCYMQITGVYPFPDYVNGFHFLDINHQDVEHRIADDDIPF